MNFYPITSSSSASTASAAAKESRNSSTTMGLKKPAHLRVNRLHYKSRKKDNDGPKYHFLRFSKNADAEEVEVDTFLVTLQIRCSENESSSVQLTIPLRPGMTIGEAKLETPEQLHLKMTPHYQNLTFKKGQRCSFQGAFMDLELASTALDLPTDAKEDEIRKTSKKLSIKLHPDKYEDDAEKKEAGEQFKVVQYAMRFMMDNLCGSKLALIIRRSDSPKFTLNVRSSHTISDVKNELSEMEFVSSDKLCVLFNGQLLKDNRTLSDYNIANENNLDLVENRTIRWRHNLSWCHIDHSHRFPQRYDLREGRHRQGGAAFVLWCETA
eukprot:scaffold5164_cov73-Skeletonema_marinoi.AAC.2